MCTGQGYLKRLTGGCQVRREVDQDCSRFSPYPTAVQRILTPFAVCAVVRSIR